MLQAQVPVVFFVAAMHRSNQSHRADIIIIMVNKPKTTLTRIIFYDHQREGHASPHEVATYASTMGYKPLKSGVLFEGQQKSHAKQAGQVEKHFSFWYLALGIIVHRDSAVSIPREPSMLFGPSRSG